MSVKSTVFAATLIGFIPFSELYAQMYRCGNAYQDRPCDSAQSSKPVTGVGSGTKSATTTGTTTGVAANPVCTQRGADSQTIVYARDSGATEEKLSAAETSQAKKQLIADVYRVRGAAPAVRARIEAECQAEMAEKEKALALHEAMVRAGALPAQKTVPAGTGTPTTVLPAERDQISAQRAAADKKTQCDSYLKTKDSIREQQRTGGSASRMDSLNRQSASVEKNIQSLGC